MIFRKDYKDIFNFEVRQSFEDLFAFSIEKIQLNFAL